MSDEEKLFYSIGEIAEILQLKPYVLRYWETEFKKLNPQKSPTGQRNYRKKDLQVAQAIKKLLYDEQYTIAGAIKKLEELEKVGFDSLNVETESPMVMEPETATHSGTPFRPETLAAEPNQSSAASDLFLQKMGEFQNLLAASHNILKKYNLA